MKRIPVTQASYKKIPAPKIPKGVKGVDISVGKPDKEKTRAASYFGYGGFGTLFGRSPMIGGTSTFYNNSYMNGGTGGGFGDVPPFLTFLSQQNGGILYFPVTLKQKFEFYRFFYRFDSYVKAAVDLNTDLPMSRLQLRMPKMNDKKLSKRIQKFYQTMIDQIHLFDKLHSILFENNILGNVVLFVEYDEVKKRWSKITILPPEQVSVANYPMSDIKRIQYRPQRLKSIIMKYDMDLESYQSYMNYVQTLPQEDQSILQDVSYEFVKQLHQSNGTLTFDTDPYSGDGDDKIGSFAFHFTTKRHEYQDWGVSPLECLTIPLIQKTLYQYAQTSLATRNMSPRQVITAEGITPQALQELRDQVDQAMLSPDYKIVTNYNISWQTIGADNRLIDLAREYETIENQLFAGLGVTRQLLTGQGMYSGNKISIEILNTKYLLVREMLQKFVEQNLFKPVALQNGFYHDDEDGNRTWYYPKLGFTRLTIRDNQEVFDALFQLYQKGSLPIGMILDIFNINSDEVDEELKRDMFTVKDATYNEMLRQIYTDMGSKISQSTDLAKQIADSMTGPVGRKLKYLGEDAEQMPDNQIQDDMGLNDFNSRQKNFDMDELNDDFQTNKDEQPVNNEQGGNTSNEQDVKSYIDSFLNQEEASSEGQSGSGEGNANDYIENILNKDQLQNESAKKYIDNILNEQVNEQQAKKYINNFLNKQDDSVNKYIDSFLGENGSNEQDNQQAGLFD